MIRQNVKSALLLNINEKFNDSHLVKMQQSDENKARIPLLSLRLEHFKTALKGAIKHTIEES